MAYYLAFTFGSEYVDIPSAISVSGDGVLAEIDFEYKGASNDVICGGTSFSDYWRINNDNQFRISIAGSANNVNLISPLVVGTRYMLKLVRTGSSVEVRDSTNTAITSATNLNANPFVIGKIGSFHNGSSNLTMDLYGFKAGSETYNPSLSNGTGSVLPTVSGSNQGMLTNFPTDNSQWVFFDDGGAVTVDVTETSDSATESSSISISANITAQITETYSDATESSVASIATLVTASVTELSQDATESSAVTITNNLVTLNVTEIAQDFTESVSATVAGKVSALVTEFTADASESSTLSISANISAAVTEIAQDFADNIGVNVVSSFTVEVTETTVDFDEACYIQLPVQRLVARKTISVNSRRSGTIRVTRRNHVIRVK